MNGIPFGRLEGRTAVVTGASSGIGRAILWELAVAGAAVCGTCRRSESELHLTLDAARQCGADVEGFTGDISDPEMCDRLMAFTRERFGPINLLVNNAGADLLTGDAARLSFEEKLHLLLTVDVEATMRLSRMFGMAMKATGGGVILNIGWDQADRGMEGDSGELFAAAKNAVMGFTRSLAVSLAPEVRVNCIAPGWIQTAWGSQAGAVWQERVMRETPLKRWGVPEDIAKAARFLCSDEASFITGQVINVNGGVVR